jgi:hypothetical protein
MVVGGCRFHSGCGSRRTGSSTESTTRQTAPWFASRLRPAFSVSCVRAIVNSCRCGLIFFCLAARHDLQGIHRAGVVAVLSPHPMARIHRSISSGVSPPIHSRPAGLWAAATLLNLCASLGGAHPPKYPQARIQELDRYWFLIL